MERVIAGEIRQFTRNYAMNIPGFELEDLEQECHMRLCSSSTDWDRKGSRKYMGAVVRSHLGDLLSRARRQVRCPHDGWGRPILDWEPGYDEIPAVQGTQEEDVIRREAVVYLKSRLDARDWDLLVAVCVEGAQAATLGHGHRLRTVKVKARQILSRIGFRAKEEAMGSKAEKTAFQPCHADGSKPIGYDAQDFQCAECADKFTCLPRAIERKLVTYGLEVDLEVQAVIQGRMSEREAMQRMYRRHIKNRAGQPIDPEERFDAPSLRPSEPALRPVEVPQVDMQEPEPQTAQEPAQEPVQEPESEPEVAQEPVQEPSPELSEGEESEVATKVVPKLRKPRRKKRAPQMVVEAKSETRYIVFVDNVRVGRIEKRPEGWGWWTRMSESDEWLDTYNEALRGITAKLQEANPAVKWSQQAKRAYSKITGKTERKPPQNKAPVDWPRMRDDRPYPYPKRLTEQEMLLVLERLQSTIGANIELDYGMQLVRRTRKGDVVTTITPYGFEYSIEQPKLVKAAGLKTKVQLFGSLSAVAQWWEGRLRTGTDFFNLAKHACTEVRSKDGRILDRKGGAPG